MVSRAFSALCVYSTFGHHPHPLATVVPNFVSLAASIAELARGEKSRTQSLNRSPSLFDAPGTEAFASELSYVSGWWVMSQALTYGSPNSDGSHGLKYG